jgi:hypothetical protein
MNTSVSNPDPEVRSSGMVQCCILYLSYIPDLRIRKSHGYICIAGVIPQSLQLKVQVKLASLG